MQDRRQGQPLFVGVSPAVGSTPQPIATVVIDAEEDFDWDRPVRGTPGSTAHMKSVDLLHNVLSAYGIVPTYLLTYPVLEDAEVVSILRRQWEKGRCGLGLQLHTWVTPPFDETPSPLGSFSGNLAPDLEEQKLLKLKDKFRKLFGFEPTVYRAGRYGLSERTADLLERHGFEIDTSLAPRTDSTNQGGQDYSFYSCRAFWFGRHRRLLAIPLCRDVVGWGPWAPMLYRASSRPLLSRLHITSMLTRLRCAERVTLSPEGNDVAAMRRLVRGLLVRKQQVFTVSFHSSSLQVGCNPYVQSKADLHSFYDRLSAILDYLAADLALQFVEVGQVPSLLERV